VKDEYMIEVIFPKILNLHMCSTRDKIREYSLYNKSKDLLNI